MLLSREQTTGLSAILPQLRLEIHVFGINIQCWVILKWVSILRQAKLKDIEEAQNKSLDRMRQLYKETDARTLSELDKDFFSAFY